jgi:phage/plasmid-like protein (TIGR03299 family)
MAHEISINSNGVGELVLGFGKNAWHTLGTIFAQGVPLSEAKRIAFPYTAVKEGLYLADGRLTERAAILRSDTAAIIGYVGKDYEAVQPSEMFDFLGNELEISSAGSLKGGSVLFVQSPIGELDVLKSGDVHKLYLTFNNSFDGSIQAQGYITSVREVCWNTVNMGLNNIHGKALKFKHTKSVHEKIRAFQDIMEGQVATAQNMQAVMDKLAMWKLTKQTYTTILDSVFPGEGTKTENIKARITELFADNDSNAFPDFAKTGYAMLNAITNYADHEKSARITSNSTYKDASMQRLENAVIGDGAKLKTEALRVLQHVLVMADGSETVEPVGFVDMGRTSTLDVYEQAARSSVDTTVSVYNTGVAETYPFPPPVEPTLEVEPVITASCELGPIEQVMIYTNAQKEYDVSITAEVNSCVRKIQGKIWRAVNIPAPAVDYQTQIYERHNYEVCTMEEWNRFIS